MVERRTHFRFNQPSGHTTEAADTVQHRERLLIRKLAPGLGVGVDSPRGLCS